MSSRNKGRDKISAPSAVNVTATPAATSVSAVKGPPDIEIGQKLIPGTKITEGEWNELIAVDDGVETVYELVDDVVCRASDIIFEHYIEREIFPYAVQAAKKSILKTMALEFVARDEGEKNTDTDPLWLPDEPPVPPPIDSWACGMIPLASAESLWSFMDALDPVQVHRPAQDKDTTEKSTMSSTISSSITSTVKSMKSLSSHRKKKLSRVRHSEPHATLVPLEHPPDGVEEVDKNDETHQSSPVRAHSHPTPLNEKDFTPFGLQSTQLSWVKGVTYDSKGNIVEMIKLDPTKFPSYRTKPRVSIIYPPKDAVRQGFAKQRAKFKSLDSYSPTFKTNKGRASLRKSLLLTKPKHPAHEILAGTMHREGAGEAGEGRKHYARRTVTVVPSDAGLSKKGSSKRFPSLPTLPSLVDTIDPLPGVSVREKGRSIHGPAPLYHHPISPALPLRPVKPLSDGRGGGILGARREGTESGMPEKHFRHSAPCTT